MSNDVDGESVSESPPSTFPIDSDHSNWDNCGIQSSDPQKSMVWGRLTPMSAMKNAEVVELENDTYTFGRISTCDVVLLKNMSDEHLQLVSKIHFKITRKKIASVVVEFLEDMSINGTYVNYKKIGHGNRVLLSNNDLIALAMPCIKVYIFTNCRREQNSLYPKEIQSKYIIMMELGAGSCGEVRLAFDKSTEKAFAMKIIRKSAYSNGGLKDPSKIMNEIKILRALSHPCVIHIEDCFDTPEICYIILTFAEGGDLMKYIMELQYISEKEAKQVFYQIVLAVQYLHSKGITHRDLKPQNILLASQGPNSLIKIADFGLSNSLERSLLENGTLHSENSRSSKKIHTGLMQTICGSPLYVAPEILAGYGRNSGGYTHMVDIWSMGVVLYVCLSGCPPFLPSSSCEEQETSKSSTLGEGTTRSISSKRTLQSAIMAETSKSSTLGEGTTRSISSKRTLQSAIMAGDYYFPRKLWNHVTDTSIDLIKKMMTVDPNQRITNDRILEHPWMQDEEMKFQVQKLMGTQKKRHLQECCGSYGSSRECTHGPPKKKHFVDD